MSFVANSILFNVNQPNSKPRTIHICSLGQLLLIACLCTSLLASCGSPQIIRSGSLSSGSLLSGSLGSGSLGMWSTQVCVHTIRHYTLRMDRDQSDASLIGHPRSNRRTFRDLACLTIHSFSLLTYSRIIYCRYRLRNSDDVHLSSDPVLVSW